MGAKPIRTTKFSSGMRKKEIRLAWDQEKPGALPGCPTIFRCPQVLKEHARF